MRYIIGIDLGTTNCALSYVDSEQNSYSIQHFAIPQLSAAGKIDTLHTLPSFCYLVSPNEWRPGSLKLPWKEETATFVGQMAKTHGARVPTHLVQSAKSWLCHVAANRRDKILPIEAEELSHRLSPVDVSAKYLVHLRDAWNFIMAKGNPAFELEEQEIILTVPASFDEVARTLTIEAARQAGFIHVTLVEEPQAAFYSWISQHEQKWEAQFKQGDCILVCDVGGGTTDFSLIEIQKQQDKLSFQRMAVGEHLLLGGDNIDAALAHHIEKKLQEKGHPQLESSQWLQLISEARTAKETLLRHEAQFDDSYTIVIQGTGSSVIKGGISVPISRSEVETLLLEGFFGLYPLPEALSLNQRRGFRTMGLPFEDEPSITKHLAHFLAQAKVEKKGINYILFNGGTFKPEIFQEAIEKSLRTWFPQTPLTRLSSLSLDLAVARGAAYYGKVRKGLGVAIGGGLARTTYLKIDVKEFNGQTSSKALTLLPRGTQEEKEFRPNQTFFLRPNVPVSFHLMSSNVRLHDQEGSLVEISPEEMHLLPPIQTILRFGRKQITTDGEKTLPVKLGIRYTAVGTLELWLEAQNSAHKWALEFQLRSATGQEALLPSNVPTQQDETFVTGHLDEAKKSITELFQPSSQLKPNRIMESLEELISAPRRDWKSSLLRTLWEPLIKGASGRKISVEHEVRWWNLSGFLLRPGFGFALDDFRIKELWKIILEDFKTQKNVASLVQMWICFRRIAGGLQKGQQMQLASELASTLLEKKRGKIEIKHKGDLYPYSEKIRAFAALERVDLPLKIRIGNALVDRILHQSPISFDYWALGRIGARHLMYGSSGLVVPQEICTKWIEELLTHQPCEENRDAMIFLLGQIARKVDQRELNIPNQIVQRILQDFPQSQLQNWLLEEQSLTAKEQEQIFGDSLPAGLILEAETFNQ